MKGTERPWPTDEQLARFGAERCSHDGCTTWVNPQECRDSQCTRHAREERRRNGRRPRTLEHRAHLREERPVERVSRA